MNPTGDVESPESGCRWRYGRAVSAATLPLTAPNRRDSPSGTVTPLGAATFRRPMLSARQGWRSLRFEGHDVRTNGQRSRMIEACVELELPSETFAVLATIWLVLATPAMGRWIEALATDLPRIGR